MYKYAHIYFYLFTFLYISHYNLQQLLNVTLLFKQLSKFYIEKSYREKLFIIYF